MVDPENRRHLNKGEVLRQRRKSADTERRGSELSIIPSSEEKDTDSNSDARANTLYCKHAEKFPHMFRASIDYSIQEKPLQIFSGIAVLTILALMAFSPAWLWGGGWSEAFIEKSFKEISKEDQHELQLRGLQVLACLTVAIMGYCFLESRDGLLVRPHPGFWRLVHGLGLTYFLFFVVLLALHRDDGRFLVRALVGYGPKKVNIFTGTLVLDCSICTKTLMRQLTSVWFMSHVIGWFLKMCIFRSWMFNLAFSLLFEACEMSLQWLVPEFQECWWDSIFIDAILSNLLGMVLGCAVMRWCGKPHFDWLGAYPACQKILLKFTPFASCDYEWSFFRTPRYLLITSMLLVISLLTEINVFLLMTVLDIPAAHYINPMRLVILGLLAFPAVAECYAQLHYKYDRMGGNLFLFVMISMVELLVCVKYGTDRFHATSPGAEIVWPWVLTAFFFGNWCWFYFKQSSPNEQKEKQIKDGSETLSGGSRVGPPGGRGDGVTNFILRIPPHACFLPLLFLMKQYLYGPGKE